MNSFLLTSFGKTHGRVSVLANRQTQQMNPNGAVFLKCGTSNPLPSWLNQRLRTCSNRLDSPAKLPLNRRRDPNRVAFKKTCPFEFTRHGRPKAGTETRPSFLPREVSQCELQKGINRFSGEALGLAPILAFNSRRLDTQPALD